MKKDFTLSAICAGGYLCSTKAQLQSSISTNMLTAHMFSVLPHQQQVSLSNHRQA